jgi:hypothetical protein
MNAIEGHQQWWLSSIFFTILKLFEKIFVEAIDDPVFPSKIRPLPLLLKNPFPVVDHCGVGYPSVIPD